MTNHVEIIENEDQSVNELLHKTAKELHAKYNKQRKIKEKYLNKKTPTQRVFSIISNILCVFVLLLAVVVCFSSVNASLNGYAPNLMGYSNLQVQTTSMVKSGINQFDYVISHSVDTDTINVGDIIIFYVYGPSSDKFKIENCKDVSSQKSETEYSLTFAQAFGFQGNEIKQAVKSKSRLVIHHVRAIYEDENGERWFKTYGSSNLVYNENGDCIGGEDSWTINENYVLGIKDDSAFSKFMVGIVSFSQKPYASLFIFIPLGALFVSIILSFLRSAQIAKLELDCVEEKRKITDTICIKNDVGYQMSNKTKYKILAQATDANREEYIKLLWRDGHMPGSVKKYYMRKKLLLSEMKDTLELNRKCEQMFKDKKDPVKIAEFYTTEKQRIEEHSERIRKKLKALDKHWAEEKLVYCQNCNTKIDKKLKKCSSCGAKLKKCKKR